MGCAYSQNTCDNDTMVFDAVNIDIAHNPITNGKLKVNKTEISFTFNNNTDVLVWPLKSLRRYGFDEQEFSFEAGRRCPSGPGIYGFKCEKADQLFYLVQQNIQVCTNNAYDKNSYDRMLREMWNDKNSCRPITRVTIPKESNYLDPAPVRNSTLHFSHSLNDRMSSIGSSSGPMSPQGTMGTPSPPPVPPLSLPPHPPNSHAHPSSSYVNEENPQNVSPGDPEFNNNKSLARRSIQRSHTASSSTSSSVFLSSEQVSGQPASNEVWTTSQAGAAVPSQSSVPSYMNVDLGSDASPLSLCDTTAPPKKESSDSLDAAAAAGSGSSTHAYINISPEKEKLELALPTAASKPRPPALPLTPLQLEPDEDARHSYANLGSTEIEALKKRYSMVSVSYGLPIQVTTPPPHSSGYREVRYAILNLDKKDSSLAPATTPVKAAAAAAAAASSSSAAATPAASEPPADSHASTPDSTGKARQNGYVIIDFDKTNALSHSVNTNNASQIIPDEGSRKTRHNSTISELMTS